MRKKNAFAFCVWTFPTARRFLSARPPLAYRAERNINKLLVCEIGEAGQPRARDAFLQASDRIITPRNRRRRRANLVGALQRHLIVDPLICVGGEPFFKAVQLGVEDHASRRLPFAYCV